MIHRVESARTAEEERKAFNLAADFSRVWEVDRLSLKDVTADGRRINGDWLLRLEWLEYSPFAWQPRRLPRSHRHQQSGERLPSNTEE